MQKSLTDYLYFLLIELKISTENNILFFNCSAVPFQRVQFSTESSQMHPIWV